MSEAYAGRAVVPGAADGELLHAEVGLSFMGGVDSSTGRVIDTHHPLHGQSVAGKVLALPSGRGSCSGSATLFELLLNGHAPAALIFRADEPILTLGVILAAEMFGVSIPVVRLEPGRLRAAALGVPGVGPRRDGDRDRHDRPSRGFDRLSPHLARLTRPADSPTTTAGCCPGTSARPPDWPSGWSSGPRSWRARTI